MRALLQSYFMSSPNFLPRFSREKIHPARISVRDSTISYFFALRSTLY